jgi:hypothetical protein
MTAKAFFRKYFWDLIVVGTLTLVSSGFAIYLAIPKNSDEHIANVTRDSTALLSIDLSLENDTAREITIQGVMTPMTLEVKKNAIRVKESGCRNQNCVYAGWVSDSNHPIVCAYNHVSIQIGASGNIIHMGTGA